MNEALLTSSCAARWLILQGRGDEAREILLRLHDDPDDQHHTFARTEYLQITKQVSQVIELCSTRILLLILIFSARHRPHPTEQLVAHHAQAILA